MLTLTYLTTRLYICLITRSYIYADISIPNNKGIYMLTLAYLTTM